MNSPTRPMGGLERLLADNAHAKARRPLNVVFAAAEGGSPAEATIFVYDVVVSDASFGGVAAQDFVTAVGTAAKSADAIHVRFNCPGGDVFAARAMEAAIRGCPKRTVAHVDGYAASAASYLALACDEVEIAQGGFFMIHNAWCLAMGNSEDLAKTSSLLEQIDASLVDTYAKETGQPREWVKRMMAAETWIAAKDAVALGFADRIAADAPKAEGSWNLAAYANPPKTDTPTRPEPVAMRTSMDVDEKRHRLQIINRQIAALNALDTAWSDEQAKAHNALKTESDALCADLDRFQAALKNAAERHASGAFAPDRPPVNQHELFAAVGQYARSGDRNGFAVMGAALTEAGDSGGVIVPHELSDVIVSTQKKCDPFRSIARVVSVAALVEATKQLTRDVGASLAIPRLPEKVAMGRQ